MTSANRRTAFDHGFAEVSLLSTTARSSPDGCSTTGGSSAQMTIGLPRWALSRRVVAWMGCALLLLGGPAGARTQANAEPSLTTRTASSEAKHLSPKVVRSPLKKLSSARARVTPTVRASTVALKPVAGKATRPDKQLKRITWMPPVVQAPAPPTLGESMGLHTAPDQLALSTGAAVLLNIDTREVIYAKNAKAVLPIASITKLMTALVVLESESPLNDLVTVTEDDIDTEKNSHSRLPVGTVLTRGEMLNLALMSSENRAAHAMARAHPGGLKVFIAGMNRRAAVLGMEQTRFIDPTGLSDQNRSTPMDLALLVQEVSKNSTIRNLSTAVDREMDIRGRKVMYRNSNALVRSGAWDIVVQKTGYIKEAGRCVVMEITNGGARWAMVLLDAASAQGRWSDARKLRDFGVAHTAAAASKTRSLTNSAAALRGVSERSPALALH